ncbi:MAG: hypothetical protein MUE85_06460 [Microscillaceae bacterium]|nr:hypothetical protein [Microscillaceae bacterium]
MDNRLLSEKISLSPDKKQHLDLNFNVLSYFRNNEYFNPIVSGETLFGYLFSPTFTYYPTEHLRLDVGAFFRQDFGSTRFSQVSPFFRLQYKKDSTSVIFGNLQANHSHLLIEPLYAFENMINRYLESGIQILHHKKWLYLDLWVDWQRRTFRGSSEQEQIWGGLSAYFQLYQSDKVSWRIPIQASILHRGGQDLVGSAFPASNTLNGAVGLNFELTNPKERFVRNIRLESYWVYANAPILDTFQFARTQVLPFELGSGAYLNGGIKTRWLELLVSWWRGNNFESSEGGELYRSYPVAQEGFFQRHRHLLFVRFFKDFKLAEAMNISLRFEPYYDFFNRRLEFSNGLYVIYRPNFYLAKIKAWRGQ